MRRNKPNGAPRWRRCTFLLIASLGLAGCPTPPPQIGESADPDPNCGIFYSCGSHSDPNQGGEQTQTGSSSDSSGSGTSSSTSGEGASAPEDE